MATDPKPAAPDDDRKKRAREKARLRKQRFDERMRNAAAGVDASPRRGCVLYLSDEARAVLRRNRERRRRLDLPPVLDSELVESLLRSYAQQGEPEDPLLPLVVDETKARPDVSNLLVKAEKLEKALKASKLDLFAAEGTIERLEAEIEKDYEFRPFDWDFIEKELLAAHRLIGGLWTRGIAERIYRTRAEAQADSMAAAAIHRELAEHIRSLISWVSSER